MKVLLSIAILIAAPAVAETPDAGISDPGLFDAGSSDAGSPAASAVNREDDIFGGDSAPAAIPPLAAPDAGPATPLAAAPSGETPAQLAPIDEGAMKKDAEDMDNKLTIGGVFYPQAQFNAVDKTAAALSPFTQPNLMDLYFDARRSDDLRAYIRARLIYNPSAGGALTSTNSAAAFLGGQTCTSQLCPYLDQAWIKFNAAHKVFFTFGKQHIKWGAGTIWNPTDFLNPQKLNPIAILDQRLGVNMLKMHIPIESLAWNFYGIITADGVSSLSQIGYAGRAEFAIGPSELTVSAAYQANQPLKLGADISMGLGDIDWYAEGALLHPFATNQIVTYQGTLDYDVLPPTFPTADDRVHQWLPQVTAGAEYTLKYSDQDSILIGLEYFYNSIGYDNSNLYLYLFQQPGAFTPLYMGKHYGAVYISIPNPGNWNSTTFSINWIGNLSDKSNVLRVDWRQTVLTWMQTDVYAGSFFGGPGELHYFTNPDTTIAGNLQLAQDLGQPVTPAIQALATRLEAGIPATSWQVGAALILNF